MMSLSARTWVQTPLPLRNLCFPSAATAVECNWWCHRLERFPSCWECSEQSPYVRAAQVPWIDVGNASWVTNWAWQALRPGLTLGQSRSFSWPDSWKRTDGGMWRCCCWDGQGFGTHPVERLKQTQSSVRNGFMFLGLRPGHAECIPEVLYYLFNMPFPWLREVCPSGLLSLIHPLSNVAVGRKKSS